MTIHSSLEPLKKIRAEYDQLYKVEPIRDEFLAYQWQASLLKKHLRTANSILDIACGGGYFLKALKTQYPSTRLSGMDLSSSALAIAKRECPDASYLLSCAESIPLNNQSFSGITCLGSMEHFLDIPRFLAEVRRLLKPDGVFLVMVPNIFWWKDLIAVLFKKIRVSRNQSHELFASWGEWSEMLEQNGFNLLRTYKYNGVSRTPWKNLVKSLVLPCRFSYHFVFVCSPKPASNL